jgi:hypothetical protein
MCGIVSFDFLSDENDAPLPWDAQMPLQIYFAR